MGNNCSYMDKCTLFLPERTIDKLSLAERVMNEMKISFTSRYLAQEILDENNVIINPKS